MTAGAASKDTGLRPGGRQERTQHSPTKMTHSGLLVCRVQGDSTGQGGEARATQEVKSRKVVPEGKTRGTNPTFLPHLPHLTLQTVAVLPYRRGRVRHFLPTSL